MNPRDMVLHDSFAFALQNSYISLVGFLPQLLWALIVLLLGLLLAKWARTLTISALTAVDFDKYFRKSKLSKFFHESDIGSTVSNALGNIVKWLVIYLFLINVFTILELTSISEFMSRLLSYAPNVLAALVIFVLSVILAGFVESFVKRTVNHLDPITSRLMGKVSSYAVVVVGGLIAISELGIAEWFINILFIGFVATLSLTLGLAFGLGSKDIVSEVLADWYKRYNQSQVKPEAKKK